MSFLFRLPRFISSQGSNRMTDVAALVETLVSEMESVTADLPDADETARFILALAYCVFAHRTGLDDVEAAEEVEHYMGETDQAPPAGALLATAH